MRLAHLHVQGLIPYSHSLRLQNAVLERHSRYKDWLRTTRNDRAVTQSRDGQGDAGHVSQGSDFSFQLDKGLELNASIDSTSAARLRPDPNDDQPPHGQPTPEHGICPSASRSTISTHVSKPRSDRASQCLPPDPVLITFSTPPTYTVGRRHMQTNPISQSQQAFLSADGLATFHASPRGGLLTYHSPGQLTGYVLADLRRHGITPRCWVKLLEESVMRTCGVWGVKTARTDDPGVWVIDPPADEGNTSQESSELGSTDTTTDRKICAIGVQVSRGITSHGVGLNIRDVAPHPFLSSLPKEPESKNGTFGFTFTPAQLSSPSYDPGTHGPLSWGFSRIVACGLQGKSVTWLAREMARSHVSAATTTTSRAQMPRPPSRHIAGIDPQAHSRGSGLPPISSQERLPAPTEEDVAAVLANEIMRGLNAMKAADKESVEGIYNILEQDIIP